MRQARQDGSIQLTVDSSLDQVPRIQDSIAAALKARRFTERDIFGIRLALEEALVNAIKHGNRLDPGKKVRVEATVTPEQAEITVEDEGPGFDRGCVPDPTADENICRPSGRGILLIESYMNDVRWDRGGRRIRMVKQNEPGHLPRR